MDELYEEEQQTDDIRTTSIESKRRQLDTAHLAYFKKETQVATTKQVKLRVETSVQRLKKRKLENEVLQQDYMTDILFLKRKKLAFEVNKLEQENKQR